ncbi:MAG TPA: 3-hydroxyacyl-CoA dehydrogenase [Acetobacteraceae bacterium]|nr:3-hydroxyacyl-CoA dehydrogenase [Acetobacteraceae bacterium]
MARTAVIGAGLIGRSWAIVFARAGHDVALWDPAPEAADAARAFAADRLPDLAQAGLLGGAAPETVLARIAVAASLADAVAAADWVQENGPERLETKSALFADLDRLAPAAAILASSTSTIPASKFGGTIPGRRRILVAHPVNPPYLIPVVEIAPATWTDPEIVAQARAFMAASGMVPAVLRREIDGFVLNRLQAALLAEAFRLAEDGVASIEDIDATIRDGLGLRWALMGPFETIDLNAPGGLADYCARYGQALGGLIAQMTPRDWSEGLVARLDADRRVALPATDLAARTAWRDSRLMALLAHKAGLRPDPPKGARPLETR